MVYECDQCDAPLPPGVTSCPWCGEVFEDAVPADAALPKQDSRAASSPVESLSPTHENRASEPVTPPSGETDAGRNPSLDTPRANPPSSQPSPRASHKTLLFVVVPVFLVSVLGFLTVEGVLTHRRTPAPSASPPVDTAPVPSAVPAQASVPPSPIPPARENLSAAQAFAALKTQTIAQIRVLQNRAAVRPPGSPSRPPFPYRVDARNRIYYLEPTGQWRPVPDEELRHPPTPEQLRQIEAALPRAQKQP